MRRLLAERDTSRVSGSLLSMANDYINSNYAMTYGMVKDLLRILREQPIYTEGF